MKLVHLTGGGTLSYVSAIDQAQLAATAHALRQVLDALPAAEDTPADAKIRRRVEGAIVATELAAGELAPRLAEAPTQ